MTTHSLDAAAPRLFSHLVAENSSNYRAILDVFATAKRQFRLHLRPDDVLAEANPTENLAPLGIRIDYIEPNGK